MQPDLHPALCKDVAVHLHVGLEDDGEDGEDAADGGDAGGRTSWAEGSADAATFSPHSTYSLPIHESSRSRPTPGAAE